MSRPLHICLWTTTCGPDLLALAWDLDAREETAVRVAVDRPALVARQPSLRARPLSAPLLDKGPRGVLSLLRWRPDVVVIDNHLPWVPLSRRGFVLWHGYGWKGPDDLREMIFTYGKLWAHWGSPLSDNHRLRWACFGRYDLEHRTRVGRIDPRICRMVGAASHDLLRRPADRRRLAPAYPLDVAGRKNVLVAPTWHYGGMLGHWGPEVEQLERLIQRARAHEANVILRLHDRWRMPPDVVAAFSALAGRWPNVLLKFKDEDPDGLADLQLADLLVTNMSSIANLFYATLRPTIHVYPVEREEAPFSSRRSWLGRVKQRRVSSVRKIWKLRPEENGGLMARSPRQLLEQLDQALEDPACCAARARTFMDRHMLGADGIACSRIYSELAALCPEL